MRPKAGSNPPDDYDDQQVVPIKRRRSHMLSRYESLKEQFDADREEEYHHQRQKLTARLDSLIAGKDQPFLEMVEDLNETRDLELVSLNLYEKFLIDRAKKDHEERMQFIEEQYRTSTKEVHEKLSQRLAAQADMLKTGQANNSFLDISSNTLDNLTNTGSKGSTSRSGTLRTNAHSGYTSNNDANGTATAGSTTASRSRLRRREAVDTDQGDATEGTAGPAVIDGHHGNSHSGGISNDHLRFFFSDFDFDGYSSGYASAAAVASGGPGPSGTTNSRSSKQTPKIPSLKQEEADSDLQAIRRERAQLDLLRRRRPDH
ncbi:hypothetical protein AWJ20_1917 [Sugiyamaella lignohabitans]|uniref:Sds3p n=1 Tax=Sugiyamaella lignohabitans TaxID=796027 RepID=A0A167E434_9ASCO|nr:uncharacterized protein AWJ20_1917 [Sugiyamaella lignohabitans]ANB13618.1 hypothetical protein AWJ20_1917 [Sugiyamaella lignohabitans]